jgi:hypothetical protein
VCVLVLVLHSCAVTVSSTGAKNQIQGDDNPRRASLRGFPCSSLSGTLVSYGASAVTRTSDRGHVFYYCRTYYKTVRVGVCVSLLQDLLQSCARGVCFITVEPITKLFAWGGEERGGHVL